MAAAPDTDRITMCSYCGCRSNTLIARFSREHEAIVNVSGSLRRAARSGDAAATRAAAELLGELVGPHTASEERSLFDVLRTSPEFTQHVDSLCAEHADIEELLAAARSGSVEHALRLDESLRRHIDKEENGLFPAAVVELDGASWEWAVARA